MGTGQTRLWPEHFDNRSSPGGLVFRCFEPHYLGAEASTQVNNSSPADQGFLADDPLMVEGNATATYTKNTSTYELTGTIQLHGIGKLDLSGTIDAISINQKCEAGQLSLSTVTGTIVLDLTHAGKPAPGAIPKEMYFTVAHATGAYSHAGGEGMVTFATTSTGPTAGTVSMSLT
jgi:hypothetical protein